MPNGTQPNTKLDRHPYARVKKHWPPAPRIEMPQQASPGN